MVTEVAITPVSGLSTAHAILSPLTRRDLKRQMLLTSTSAPNFFSAMATHGFELFFKSLLKNQCTHTRWPRNDMKWLCILPFWKWAKIAD